MNRQVIIFDTTLRDGEQALQTSLNVEKKLKIALALESLGVDVMEVGFPISSPGDFKSVQTIARNIKNSWVCGLARCIDKDIDVAAEALKVSKNFRIHVFLATSTLHIKSKLKRSFEQIVDMAIHSVKYARQYTDDVEFSCEDAGRTSIDNLCRIVEATINAGARTINIPDTVGYTIPSQFSNIITILHERVPSIDKAIVSVHCHNDLGMAVSNSIAAIQAGARQVEGTLNGIGERAGNAALEEIVMAIKVRHDLLGVYTNINHSEIYRVSQIVSQLCDVPIAPNKAIVGANAFTHSSGIHQDGVLKNRQNYEIITPETIGLSKIRLNLTSRSGRAAVKYHMQAMGYYETDYDMDKLYNAFLKLADKKGQVFDYELEALAFIDDIEEQSEHYVLKYFTITLNSLGNASVVVKLICGNEVCVNSATGFGPIDAIYNVLFLITHISIKIKTYKLTTKSRNLESLSRADIIVEYAQRCFHGIGLAVNIIESFVQAMVNALNNIWRARKVDVNLCKLN